mgnify:CR=1 FL=1
MDKNGEICLQSHKAIDCGQPFPRLLMLDSSPVGQASATGQLKSIFLESWPTESFLQIWLDASGNKRPTLHVIRMGEKWEEKKNVFYTEKEIIDFCLDFKPDVIYFRPVASEVLLEFTEKIVGILKKPLATHIMDDWLENIRESDPARFAAMEATVRRMLSLSTIHLSICDAMSLEYRERYGYEFKALANGVDISEFPEKQIAVRQPLSEQAPFTLRYLGGLADDMTFSSVCKIARLVSLLHKSQPIKIEIFTMSWFRKKAEATIGDLPGVSVFGCVPDAQKYRSILQGADALVIAYNFDEASIRHIRLSMANKMPECLASGAPLLAFGPKGVATIDYLLDTGCALVVSENDDDALRHAICKLTNDSHFRSGISGKARTYVAQHHSKSSVQEKFWEYMHAAATYRPIAKQGSLTLSLVTPSLNQKIYLAQMLESVKVQTAPPCEHLIFDAGSTDGSFELLRAYEQESKNVKLYHGIDNGQTNAINLGFKECTGDIIAWLNTDDRYISPRIFAKVLKFFTTHEDVDVIYGRGRFVDEESEFLKEAFVHKDSSRMEERLINAVGILQPSLFMRRTVFESVGPLNESLDYCMDYEYWIRAAQSGYRFCFIDEVFSEAVLHQHSKTGGQRSAQLKETAQMCKQHFGFSAIEWIERLADMELTESDGILKQGDRHSSEFNQRVLEHFHEFNGNRKSLAAIWSRAGCPEAAKTVKYIQEHGPKYEVFVTTAFNSRFFHSGLTLIARLHSLSKSKLVTLVYDIGLKTDELAILSNLKNVYVLKLPAGDPRWFDEYFTPQTYGFKSYIAWHAGKIAPDGALILWMDAGIAPNRDIEQILELVRKDDVFFVNHDDVWPKTPYVNMTFATDPCVDGMSASNDELLAPHIRAGLFGYKAGGKYHKLFDEAYQYSLNPSVISGDKHPVSERIEHANPGINPVKALLANPQEWTQLSRKKLRQLFGFLGHRHDQSIVSILAARYQAPVKSATQFCARYKNSSEISKKNWKSSFQDSNTDFDFRIDASCPSSNAICVQHRGLFTNHSGLEFEMIRKKRAIVLGNGPSLKGFDFKRLVDFDVFGMNAAYRYWDRIGWYPQYYSCLDLVVGVSHRDEIIRLIENSHEYGIRAFLLRDNLIKQIGSVRNHERVMNFDLIQGGSELLTAPTITTGSHTAAWAAYLGYKEIYLLGIDCNYVELIDGARQGQGTELILESTPESNPNYFFDDYQQLGDHYNIPNPDRDIHLESWREVAECLQDTNAKILNANLLSKVDAFDFCDVDDLLNSKTGGLISRETVFFCNFILANQLAGKSNCKAVLSVNNPFPAALRVFENYGFDVHQASDTISIEKIDGIEYLQIYSFEAAVENLRHFPWERYKPSVIECLHLPEDKGGDESAQKLADILYNRGYTVYFYKQREEKMRGEAICGSNILQFPFKTRTDLSFSNMIAFLQPVSAAVIGKAAACLEIDSRKRLALKGIEFKYFSRGAGFDGEKFNLNPSKGHDRVVVAYKCAISPNQKVSASISFYIDSPCNLNVTLCRDGNTPYEHDTQMLDLDAGRHCFNIDHVFQKMHWGVRVQIGVTKSPVAISKIAITVSVGQTTAKTEQSGEVAKPFLTTFLPVLDTTVLGPYERNDHAHWDETKGIAELFSENLNGSVMIDVGAHVGTALAPFLEMGWRIFAFEPDNKNRSKLLERLSKHKHKDFVTLDTRCVSNKSQKGVCFFTSEESTGISGLSAFHETHHESQKVDITTLTEFFQDKSMPDVDFLKIDTEGHDMFVLQGYPWESGKPAVIECEFEDLKTVPLGYTFHDLACFLVEKGYNVYVSEWHPIIRYGIPHDWQQLMRYPCELADPKSWGNLLAFRGPIDEQALVASLKKVMKLGATAPGKAAASVRLPTSPVPIGKPYFSIEPGSHYTAIASNQWRYTHSKAKQKLWVAAAAQPIAAGQALTGSLRIQADRALTANITLGRQGSTKYEGTTQRLQLRPGQAQAIRLTKVFEHSHAALKLQVEVVAMPEGGSATLTITELHLTETLESLCRRLGNTNITLTEANRRMREGDHSTALPMYLYLHEQRPMQMYADNALFAARKLDIKAATSINELKKYLAG